MKNVFRNHSESQWIKQEKSIKLNLETFTYPATSLDCIDCHLVMLIVLLTLGLGNASYGTHKQTYSQLKLASKSTNASKVAKVKGYKLVPVMN